MEFGIVNTTGAAKARHFRTVHDLSPDELDALMSRTQELKPRVGQRSGEASLAGRVLGMLFEKASTRTRISFEAGMFQLGGHAIFLSPRDIHLGRGEPIEDTARIMSSMVDAIVIRTFAHERLERFAAHSTVPVINALTDRHHPCQLLADMYTYKEHRGSIAGRTVAWVGDGNNMCNSYIHAASAFDFRLRIGCPEGYAPDPELVAGAGDSVVVTHDAIEAATDSDLVVTDVWASMGQEDEHARRSRAFADFQVNSALLAHARPDALVMHCLPAHRGEEISAEALEGAHSVVWDEAENRLHTQKALLEHLLCADAP